MLKTQVEEIALNKVAITVEVERERVAAAYSSFFERASRSVNIPGFRRGKVPRKVLMNYIGREAVDSQIEEELVKEIYPQAIVETDLHPVSPFTIEESHLKEGEPFSFKATFEVCPKIDPFERSGMEVTVQKAIIDDESVEKVIGKLQGQFSKFEPVSESVAIKDLIVADCKVICEGEPVANLTSENLQQLIGSENPLFMPLIGLKTGDSKTYSHKNEDVPDSDPLKGKTLEVSVMIKSVSRLVPPELNDAFAKQVGEYQSMAELREKIRVDLEEQAEIDAQEAAFEKIMDVILSKQTVVVPEAMVQNMMDSYIERLNIRWQSLGTTIEDYMKKSGGNFKEFREGFRERAVKQTQVALIIDAIARDEKIEVSNGEYNEEVQKRADKYHIPFEKLLADFARDHEEESVKFSLRNRKIRDFLLKNNIVHYDMVKETDLNKGEAQGDVGTDSN